MHHYLQCWERERERERREREFLPFSISFKTYNDFDWLYRSRQPVLFDCGGTPASHHWGDQERWVREHRALCGLSHGELSHRSRLVKSGSQGLWICEVWMYAQKCDFPSTRKELEIIILATALMSNSDKLLLGRQKHLLCHYYCNLYEICIIFVYF